MLKIIRKAINENTAAVLIEPIQGEGGIVVPPENYLPEVRDICSKHNVLMILDEIQSGLGRTGKLFAYQHSNIQPDGLDIRKSTRWWLYACFMLFIFKRSITMDESRFTWFNIWRKSASAAAIAKTISLNYSKKRPY